MSHGSCLLSSFIDKSPFIVNNKCDLKKEVCLTHRRAHVVMPVELLEAIDRTVGQRKRSLFLASAAEKELARLNQLSVFEKSAGAWSRNRHPELEKRGGVRRFIRSLRREGDRRL